MESLNESLHLSGYQTWEKMFNERDTSCVHILIKNCRSSPTIKIHYTTFTENKII